MVLVEQTWLACLVRGGLAPARAATELSGLLDVDDLAGIAAEAEASGTPVLGLLDRLRSRLAGAQPDGARWLHRGLTSQDVVDSALMYCAGEAIATILSSVGAQLGALIRLAERHRDTVQTGRTLTQPAVPITFGLKAAGWLTAVLDVAEDLTRVARTLPIQLGGAAGTNAALVELCRSAGAGDPIAAAEQLVADAAGRLGLQSRPPWHSYRRPVTVLGDALVSGCDAFGRIAGDVLVLSRPEIGELSESRGGGSSTMPHKQNPTLAVLVRRASITAPGFAATLHLAAAGAVDERPPGEWHAEWATVRALSRITAVAASQLAELLTGLQVHGDVMRARAEAAGPQLLSERAAIRELVPAPSEVTEAAADAAPESYLGASDRYLGAAVQRGRTWLELRR